MGSKVTDEHACGSKGIDEATLGLVQGGVGDPDGLRAVVGSGDKSDPCSIGRPYRTRFLGVSETEEWVLFIWGAVKGVGEMVNPQVVVGSGQSSIHDALTVRRPRGIGVALFEEGQLFGAD